MFLNTRNSYLIGFVCKRIVTVNYSKNTKHPFDIIQLKRKDEASRSVLFVFNSPSTALVEHCQFFGKISSVFFFENHQKDYALVEYSDRNSLKKLFSTTRHFENDRRIPFESNLIYFQSSKKPKNSKISRSHFKCHIIDDYKNIKLDSNHLAACKDIESQMHLLYKKQKLSELDIRLRYFLASQVQLLASKIFPQASVQLFGSSVTGLGRFDGDVDMSMEIENDENFKSKALPKSFKNTYFITRIRPEDYRSFSQKMMESFGCLLKNIFPQLFNVHLILRATVPIVKFHHSPSGIEGDVCYANQEAIEMSRQLYTIFNYHSTSANESKSNNSNQVLPILFTLRQWAKSSKVSQSSPGPWLSTFMLTLLSVFHMQHLKILPPLKNLQENCHEVVSNKVLKIDEVITDFFKFYSQFDFSIYGISVYEGESIQKPLTKVEKNIDTLNNLDPKAHEFYSENKDQVNDMTEEKKLPISKLDCYNKETDEYVSTPLYIQNPIEKNLNAAKNVLLPNLTHFQQSCQEAYDALSSPPSTKNEWGLLKILTLDATELQNPTEYNDADDVKITS